MLITDAHFTKAKRIAVFADDEFAVALEEIVWAKSGLKIGSQISSEELNALSEESNLIKAKQRAFNMLSQQNYTKSQMEKRLSMKTSPQSAKKATEKMEELGLINDTQYAKDYAESLFRYKLYGKKRIKKCLFERGIEKELIEDTLDELDFSEDFERAVAVANKKYPIVENEKDVKRLFAALVRYGYDYDVIKNVLEEVKIKDGK